MNLEGHPDVIRSVALSCEGRKALSGSDDKTMQGGNLNGEVPT